MKRLLVLYPVLFILIGLIAACTAKRPTSKLPFQRDVVKAEQLVESGKPKEAAELYGSLANRPSTYQDQFRLLAVESLVESGSNQQAQLYADAIDPANLSPQQRHYLNLLYAQISLSSGNAEQALEQLDLITLNQLARDKRITYYKSRAFAFSLTGKLLDSTRQRIKLSSLLKESGDQQENFSAILETLSLLPDQTLQSAQTSPPDILGGWISIARILKRHKTESPNFNISLSDWKKNYPRHPANSFLQDYLAKPGHAFKLPNSIAVLLPESGPYTQAAQAVREGFMAAYYQQGSGSFKPGIKFYDSESTLLPLLYQQAVSEGAELVIGPLDKKNIESLAEIPELNVPVLALNQVDGLIKNNLFQFGLSPRDEAEQVVRQAFNDGHRKVLLLVPDSPLGKRIASYFNDSWQQIDGTILEAQAYNPKESDYSYPIKQLLNLDESAQRYRQIRALAPGIKFIPRRRHDVDAIFMTGRPRQARLLNPQLQFYRASRVPVYATSRVYNGRPNPSQDIDLNNVTFCDTPWLYEESYQGELSLQTLQSTWQQLPNIYLRLIALGIDAYNLLPHLDKLDSIQYQGATGNLLLTTNNRVKRNLLCARFVEGIPQVIEAAVEPVDALNSGEYPYRGQ